MIVHRCRTMSDRLSASNSIPLSLKLRTGSDHELPPASVSWTSGDALRIWLPASSSAALSSTMEAPIPELKALIPVSSVRLRPTRWVFARLDKSCAGQME
jgi:hypothetical protein